MEKYIVLRQQNTDKRIDSQPLQNPKLPHKIKDNGQVYRMVHPVHESCIHKDRGPARWPILEPYTMPTVEMTKHMESRLHALHHSTHLTGEKKQ
jgi:hypothetical protein